MSQLNPQEQSYLDELYRTTSGDPAMQVSMHDVGAAIGLDKEAAGKLAEELIALGHVEIRTLSGGIGITDQGIGAVTVNDGAGDANSWRLGDAVTVDEQDRSSIEAALAAIKTAVASDSAAYPQMESLVIDIKTIEVQMLSPQPRTAVIREVFRSLQETLTAMKLTEQAAAIQQMANA